MPSRPTRPIQPQPRVLAPRAGLVLLLLLLALLAYAGVPGVVVLVLTLLALAVTVGTHLRVHVQRCQRPRRDRAELLRTPAQVGFSLALVAPLGSLVAIVAANALSVMAGSVVGDGHLLLRLGLVVFALFPCVSIGYRCGRWWAFTGSACLGALLLLSALILGPRSSEQLGSVAFAVAVIALATATGSLQRALHRAHGNPRASARRNRPAGTTAGGAAARTAAHRLAR